MLMKLLQSDRNELIGNSSVKGIRARLDVINSTFIDAHVLRVAVEYKFELADRRAKKRIN